MSSKNLILEDDKMCFACGRNNAIGLKLRFELKTDNLIETEFIPQKAYQGFKDIVHGGIISLILDESMLNLLWKTGRPAVTASLTVDFKSAAKVGEGLIFSASIDKEDRRIIYAKAQARKKNGGVLIATAFAKCFVIYQ
ncbi:MAG: thioesterase [Candidatus Omnitrophica bacterium CG11_big_fil_rev_8_21_14_0_20_42_13]|uniref:Acyl-coenzyme A thioesterase THEM4 n=1 Tax=Candidatus Ghiorseimicrobium undicola TaxID=1974746 RepID=A0A2H0LYT7_9BACT|nr:MAG: thioesterase [Candidatus Omnitrophica bacterium CG11_big_fil_rev_8_21_14_0_20_42_13]